MAKLTDEELREKALAIAYGDGPEDISGTTNTSRLDVVSRAMEALCFVHDEARSEALEEAAQYLLSIEPFSWENLVEGVRALKEKK